MLDIYYLLGIILALMALAFYICISGLDTILPREKLMIRASSGERRLVGILSPISEIVKADTKVAPPIPLSSHHHAIL